MSKLILGGEKSYKMNGMNWWTMTGGQVVTDTLNWGSEKIFPETWMTRSQSYQDQGER